MLVWRMISLRNTVCGTVQYCYLCFVVENDVVE